MSQAVRAVEGPKPGGVWSGPGHRGPRSSGRTAGLCPAHPEPGPCPRAKLGGPWRTRPDRAAPDHPAQPGTQPHAQGRRQPHAVVPAGHLPHGHGQPLASALAHPSPARPSTGERPAPSRRGFDGSAGRSPKTGLAPRQRCGTHHRSHRAATGAPARARWAARNPGCLAQYPSGLGPDGGAARVAVGFTTGTACGGIGAP